jgi:hypothetical protein
MLTENQNEKITLFVMAFLFAGIERFIPVIPVLPWLKIGFFHAIVMVWIYRFGFLDALVFIFIRQWVFMSFFGFSLLPFLLGTGATVISVSFGATLIKSGKFGIIVTGIFCAFIHNITQLSILYILMKGNFIWHWQLPFIMAVSLFTGAVTGFLAYKISKTSFNFYINKNFEKYEFQNEYNIFGILTVLFVIVLSCIFENYFFYAGLFLLILLASLKTDCKLLSVSLFLRRYGIFLFVLYLSSHFSLLSVSKVSLWFLLTPFFQKFGFYRLFYALVLKLFPQKHSQTLSIGVIMPQIFPSILEEIPHLVKNIFKNPENIMDILLKKSQKILSEWEKSR